MKMMQDKTHWVFSLGHGLGEKFLRLSLCEGHWAIGGHPLVTVLVKNRIGGLQDYAKWLRQSLKATYMLQITCTLALRLFFCWDIVGLVEAKWPGFWETVTDENHRLWYSGKETRHEHGISFLVVGTVINCTHTSSMLIPICITARPHNVSMFTFQLPFTKTVKWRSFENRWKSS